MTNQDASTTATHTLRDLDAEQQPVIVFAASKYSGGRHSLLCGEITMGAVVPPISQCSRWVWRLFSFGSNPPREGQAKDETEAKGHLAAALALTLKSAGLKPADPASGAAAREARNERA